MGGIGSFRDHFLVEVSGFRASEATRAGDPGASFRARSPDRRRRPPSSGAQAPEPRPSPGSRSIGTRLRYSLPLRGLAAIQPIHAACPCLVGSRPVIHHLHPNWLAHYPTHEFAKWMGHSPVMAAKHYLQSREVHFRSATGSEPWATGCVPEGAKSVAPRVQNRLQLASAVDGTGSAYEHATPETQRGCTNVSESVQPRAVSSDGRYWIRTSDPTRVMRVL